MTPIAALGIRLDRTELGTLRDTFEPRPVVAHT
jgi:hypothetical protein